MKSIFKTLLLSSALVAAPLLAKETPPPKIGVVNFVSCVTDSKVGKQEQASFEALKKQMSSLVEESEKQLHDLSGKLQDKDYLDGLSPEAEEEMKMKFQALNDDMGRYQQQYYQVLNQANMKLVQTVSQQINTAAEKVAAAKGINVVANKEAFFYYLPSLDLTSDVIQEMDKTFDAAQPPAAQPQEAKK
jgi:outer membrane protein